MASWLHQRRQPCQRPRSSSLREPYLGDPGAGCSLVAKIVGVQVCAARSANHHVMVRRRHVDMACFDKLGIFRITCVEASGPIQELGEIAVVRSDMKNDENRGIKVNRQVGDYCADCLHPTCGRPNDDHGRRASHCVKMCRCRSGSLCGMPRHRFDWRSRHARGHRVRNRSSRPQMDQAPIRDKGKTRRSALHRRFRRNPPG